MVDVLDVLPNIVYPHSNEFLVLVHWHKSIKTLRGADNVPGTGQFHIRQNIASIVRESVGVEQVFNHTVHREGFLSFACLHIHELVERTTELVHSRCPWIVWKWRVKWVLPKWIWVHGEIVHWFWGDDKMVRGNHLLVHQFWNPYWVSIIVLFPTVNSHNNFLHPIPHGVKVDVPQSSIVWNCGLRVKFNAPLVETSCALVNIHEHAGIVAQRANSTLSNNLEVGVCLEIPRVEVVVPCVLQVHYVVRQDGVDGD